MNQQPPRQILHKIRVFQTRIFVLIMLPIILFNGATHYAGAERMIMQWVSILCLLTCAFGRVFSSVYIGGRKNEELVRYGVFSIVRNPLYVFSFIGVVGLGLMCNSYLITLALMLIFIVYYRTVVLKEEHFLTLKFGESFKDYMREVPRWIPKFSRWQSPAIVESKPIFVLRTMRDAAAFFAIIPLTQTVLYLQHIEKLPVYWNIP